ncbi:hypothetical protein [uncultured Gimesia sp.]|uniref:hypothetical protein n=1 Tax=uncultured Gimesia sp. TaxID=1678688 RepID=UPI002621E7D6|nr:hypothetical protein [uncultured Gimesia sp.]
MADGSDTKRGGDPHHCIVGWNFSDQQTANEVKKGKGSDDISLFAIEGELIQHRYGFLARERNDIKSGMASMLYRSMKTPTLPVPSFGTGFSLSPLFEGDSHYKVKGNA